LISSTVAPANTGVATVAADLVRRPAEVRLEDLPDVHSGGHAQRVQHHVHRGPVRNVRHVLLGRIFATTPLLPWRPAILSPTESFRFLATYTFTSLTTPGGSSSPG